MSRSQFLSKRMAKDMSLSTLALADDCTLNDIGLTRSDLKALMRARARAKSGSRNRSRFGIQMPVSSTSDGKNPTTTNAPRAPVSPTGEAG
jgi:hypothetical protein